MSQLINPDALATRAIPTEYYLARAAAFLPASRLNESKRSQRQFCKQFDRALANVGAVMTERVPPDQIARLVLY